MPLTATVLMVEAIDGESVTVNLKVNDGTSDVIDQDYRAGYRPSHDDLKKDVQANLILQMQAAIDRYKAEEDVKGNLLYTAMADEIKAGLVL